jgi:NAD(P)H-hydrate epimerase
MTPHPGELARLMNEKVRDIQNNRFAAITHAAKILNAWIVLKGYRTLLASPQDPLAGGDLSEFVRTEEPAFLDVNSTGNPAMATGGMGDVLAGLLGARLAQVDRKNSKKNEIIFGWREAIGAAIYIHGLAGDLAQKKFGDESLLPRDLIASIPEAFRFAIHGP